MSQPFHVAFLAEELRRRKEKNRLYSLRAFAKSLDLPASAVSRLLACKQEMSVAVAIQIIKKLKLGPDEQERFVFSVAQEKHEHTLLSLNEGAEIDALSAALRESEERYRRLIESVDQGVAIHELVRDGTGNAVDARILRVNPAWESLTGVSQQAATAGLLSELFPRAFPELIVLYDRAVRTRVAQRQEISFVDRDLWIDALIVPLEGDRYMAIGVNTTERRRIEERKSYLLGLNTVLKDLADPVEIQAAAARCLGEHLRCTNVYYSEYDAEKYEATVNAGYAAAGAQSLVGTYPLSNFSSAIEAGREGVFIMEDARTLERLSDGERETYLSIPILSAIHVALVKGGELVAGLTALNAEPRKWRSLETELLEETAELAWSAMARAHAETALRKSESRLALVFETLPLAIGIVDDKGELLLSNREMRTYLPTSKIPSRDPSQVPRWKCFDSTGEFVPPHDFAAARALRGDEYPDGLEMTFACEDGTEERVRVTSRAVRDPKGGITGAFLVVQALPD